MAYKYSTSNSRKLYIPLYILTIFSSIAIIIYIFIGPLTPYFLLTPPALIISVIILTEFHRAYDLYEVNSRSVVHRSGYYHTHTRRIDLYAISDVIVHQSFHQRLFDFGNIHVRLFSSESKSVLKNLDKPHWFAEMIESNMHEARGNTRKHFQNSQNSQKTALEDPSDHSNPQEKHPSKHQKNEETDDEIIERLEEI